MQRKNYTHFKNIAKYCSREEHSTFVIQYTQKHTHFRMLERTQLDAPLDNSS